MPKVLKTLYDRFACSCWLQLSVNAPPGVWICSTDMILTVAPDTSKLLLLLQSHIYVLL